MLYIFLSACCSVGVSVLIKLYRRYNIDIFQAITWNYLAATLLALVFFKPELRLNVAGPVYLYTSLGLLLPALFVIIGLSIKYAGIARTDVAQRMSLLIPVILSFTLLGEQLNGYKAAAIVTGLVAIACLIPWNKTMHNQDNKGWLYLLIVFAGMGIIDVLFKQMAASKGTPYYTSLLIVYMLAFALCLARLIYLLYSQKARFALHYVLAGLMLGVANFGNILFYLKAHQALAAQPSVVFSVMNIGVIALGTVVGLTVFKEKLSWLNITGIVLAVASVLILYINFA